MWHGPLFVDKSRAVDAVQVHDDVEFELQHLYWEKQVLIDSIENWIESLEGLCGKNITA